MSDETGILPCQDIEAMASKGAITATRPFDADQVQPASLDLRLGTVAWRIRASFLPGAEASVAERAEPLILHKVSLVEGAVLETGCVYLVPLMEGLKLPAGVAAFANPKSSTGRLDIFTRVIADKARAFDRVPEGYEGPLYLEIAPRTFPVLVRAGSRLSQIRFRRGEERLSDADLAARHAADPILAGGGLAEFAGGVNVSVDLDGAAFSGVVGYRARRHTGVIDVDRKAACSVADFWDPILPPRDGQLILEPDAFYILASREAVAVPPDTAAEMVPFDPLVGEFRVHYAGFFDPGFGHSEAGGRGARAVLEVRAREVPFIIEPGQTVGRLIYEKMASLPARLYGAGAGSNYQAQGLKLSKHFA